MKRWISNSSLGKKDNTKKPRQSLGIMDGLKGKRKWQQKRIMYLGTWNVQGLKNKCEIVIRDLENLKLDMIALTETKTRVVDQKQLVVSFISIVEYLKTDEQREESYSLKQETL